MFCSILSWMRILSVASDYGLIVIEVEIVSATAFALASLSTTRTFHPTKTRQTAVTMDKTSGTICRVESDTSSA